MRTTSEVHRHLRTWSSLHIVLSLQPNASYDLFISIYPLEMHFLFNVFQINGFDSLQCAFYKYKTCVKICFVLNLPTSCHLIINQPPTRVSDCLNICLVINWICKILERYKRFSRSEQ